MLTAEQVKTTVDGLGDELVSFLQKLVQTPSLPDQEHAVQDLIAARLQASRLAVDLVPTRFMELRHHPAFGDDGFSPDERVNVVGRWRGDGSSGQGSLMLNGHVDVVSPGDEAQWSASPWSGLRRNGRIYGRGSCDMKAGLTAAVFAIRALQKLDFQPARDVLISSVIGEESGGVGALTTIVKGYRADGVVVLEPTRLEVCPVQAGALTFRLSVQGKAAHAAMKAEGVNAIDKFVLLHEAIEALDRERHNGYSHPLYDDATNVAPIVIGTVRGGRWHSTLAESVVAEGRCGVFPDETADEVRTLLAGCVRRVARSDPWLREHPPRLEWFEGQFESCETPVDHPLLQILADCHRQVHGLEPRIKGVTYGSDLRLFVKHAGMPGVLYGPGDVRLAHTVDESVAIDEVLSATVTLALLIQRWCGATKENDG